MEGWACAATIQMTSGRQRAAFTPTVRLFTTVEVVFMLLQTLAERENYNTKRRRRQAIEFERVLDISHFVRREGVEDAPGVARIPTAVGRVHLFIPARRGCSRLGRVFWKGPAADRT